MAAQPREKGGLGGKRLLILVEWILPIAATALLLLFLRTPRSSPLAESLGGPG